MTAGPMLSQVEVDGLRIGYRRAGAGPPLVLLHDGLAPVTNASTP
jgi:pimeloyl-ACP methyl ester carboxylesterase